MRTLYKIDENNNIRVWSIEVENDKYRTHSGVQGGKIVISGWKTAKPKNVGKKNATTGEEQAIFERDRKYVEQLEQGGYYETIEDAKEKVQTYFDCMLAHKWEDEKHRVAFPVTSQPKLDGVRCVLTKDGMKSRNGKPLVAAPHIFEQFKEVFDANPDLVFDGELYNHELKNDFERLISLVRKMKPTTEDLDESAKIVQFHVYDMFDPHADTLTTVARNGKLSVILPVSDSVVLVDSSIVLSQEKLDELYGAYLEAGFEGQMIRLNKPYEMKRSRSLLKRKEFEDKEFKIKAIESGVGNWADYAKIIHITLEDGSEQKSGVRGSMPFLAQVLEEADEYTHATVRFQNRTSDGKLRFPVAVALFKGERDL